MSNNNLIVHKENMFTKIKNFFKILFFKKEQYNYTNVEPQKVEEDIKKIQKPNIDKYEEDKKNFLELYENSKKGKVDLLSLTPETLEKMCILLEEEIKIKERNNEIKRMKLNNY